MATESSTPVTPASVRFIRKKGSEKILGLSFTTSECESILWLAEDGAKAAAEAKLDGANVLLGPLNGNLQERQQVRDGKIVTTQQRILSECPAIKVVSRPCGKLNIVG